VDDAALWKADPGGTVTLLARSGDVVYIEGVKRKLQGFALYPGDNQGSDCSGRSGSIDDHGNVALRATFADFNDAIFVISSRLGVPDPGGGGGGGGDPPCSDLQSYHAALSATLPDPVTAGSKSSKRFSLQLGKLDAKLGKSIAKALGAGSVKKVTKFFKRAAKVVGKMQAKALKAESKGALEANRQLLEAAATRMRAQIPF
jgi:hypothetical protein